MSHWFLRNGGGILEKARPDPHGNLCYEGDAFQVAKDAAADSEFSEADAKISTSGRVSFFKRERTCLRGRGHPDRWECLESSTPSPAETFTDRCANHGSGSGLPEDDSHPAVPRRAPGVPAARRRISRIALTASGHLI